MLAESGSSQTPFRKPDWYQDTAKYGQPNLGKAIGQLFNTLLPYAALWVLMLLTVQQGYSYWITLGLALAAALFFARLFIIFHDCCHNSFFAYGGANRILGNLLGIVTFTSFENWQRTHGIHHATVGDLDRRGVGDVWTLTVEEYLAAPRWKRLKYRIYRNPFILLVVGPTVLFLILHRFPIKNSRKRERYGAVFNNLAIIGIIAAAGLTVGLQAYVLVQLPIILIAGTIGVWLFYVQHQFEGVYWARHEEWDPNRIALEGSSYYKLPMVLQWGTGNIGLHHVHHIRPRIPNYNLQPCYDAIAALQAVEPLTIRKSLKSLWLNLWDEKKKRLVSFHSLKGLPQGGNFPK
jgi:acyl-lipid omega-6 desaturase (Delta-12 desaturase)